MKRIEKWIALLLILTMTLSLAACSSKSKDPYDEIPESTQGKDVTRNAGAEGFRMGCQ